MQRIHAFFGNNVSGNNGKIGPVAFDASYCLNNSSRVAVRGVYNNGVDIGIYKGLHANFEVVADTQKSAFKADPANAGRFITTGLWSWSRHPNYFGEITLWTGMAVLALPVLSGWNWVALISPVFVFVLLTRISGIPMLEHRARKRWGDDPAFQAYTANTSVLVPLPPKKR